MSKPTIGRTASNIELLAGRLRNATDWVRESPDLGRLPIGYFGASTGAARGTYCQLVSAFAPLVRVERRSVGGSNAIYEYTRE